MGFGLKTHVYAADRGDLLRLIADRPRDEVAYIPIPQTQINNERHEVYKHIFERMRVEFPRLKDAVLKVYENPAIFKTEFTAIIKAPNGKILTYKNSLSEIHRTNGGAEAVRYLMEDCLQALDHRLDEMENEMYGSQYMGGAGGNASCSMGGVGSSYHYATASGYNSYPFPGQTQHVTMSGIDAPYEYEETKEEIKQREREERARERMRRAEERAEAKKIAKALKVEKDRIAKAKREFTIAQLPEGTKEMMIDTLQATLKAHNRTKGINQMTKGIKWFLFFLGAAIMLNFGKILDIIVTLAQ